ncbi:MAG: YkvA family protein [Acidobacteriota bacterium]|nr:YkvA family protein [Acidobacteriota bacterium]
MSEIETAKPGKVTRKEKSELKGRMSGFLMFLPNMLKLLGKLLSDGRVPLAEKALFAAAIVYVIVPLDFIPDVFPFIGQVDDVYLVALTLLRLINRTDEKVVRENWSGGGDIIGLANSIAGIAPMLLPKRVSRVLSAEVELTPEADKLRGLTKKGEALIVEIPAKQSENQKINR